MARDAEDTEDRIGLADRAEAFLARALIWLALRLPYKTRVRTFGWLVAKVAAPVAGWKRRARKNLADVFPEMSEAEARRTADAVCNNVGRTLIEIYSGQEFLDRVQHTPVEGPGAEIFRRAKAEGRRMVLATAHIGNYDVIRGGLTREGIDIGALYKPMSNKAFNPHYVRAISEIGEQVFPVGRSGVPNLVRYLKEGGSIGIVADVANFKTPVLSFFGRPTHTALSAADWSVKYDALMIPIFALRQEDGLSFRIHVAEPIPHGPSEEMMQRFNDIVENLIRQNVDQWFWIHRRWRLSRAEREALAEGDPA